MRRRAAPGHQALSRDRQNCPRPPRAALGRPGADQLLGEVRNSAACSSTGSPNPGCTSSKSRAPNPASQRGADADYLRAGPQRHPPDRRRRVRPVERVVPRGDPDGRGTAKPVHQGAARPPVSATWQARPRSRPHCALSPGSRPGTAGAACWPLEASTGACRSRTRNDRGWGTGRCLRRRRGSWWRRPGRCRGPPSGSVR